MQVRDQPARLIPRQALQRDLVAGHRVDDGPVSRAVEHRPGQRRRDVLHLPDAGQREPDGADDPETLVDMRDEDRLRRHEHRGRHLPRCGEPCRREVHERVRRSEECECEFDQPVAVAVTLLTRREDRAQERVELVPDARRARWCGARPDPPDARRREQASDPSGEDLGTPVVLLVDARGLQVDEEAQGFGQRVGARHVDPIHQQGDDHRAVLAGE